MGLTILFRVMLSVAASAVQKRLLLDRAGVHHTWILTYGIILLPSLVLASLNFGSIGGLFIQDIIVGGGLDALGNLAMVAALRSTDLSIFGPLNALRPILALMFGWLFLGESPTPLGLVGIGITVGGGVILFSGGAGERATDRRGKIWKVIFLRVIGLTLGVLGAVFLKRAALVSSAEVTVAAWILSGLVVLVGFAKFRHPEALETLGPSLGSHWKWLLIHSTIFMSMQLATIRIFQSTLLAYSFVFFQLGMILQVFVGKLFFKEGAFFRRLIAAVVMALGSVLILWRG
jgi:drug/metabolite transporter (DMT)-like permease